METVRAEQRRRVRGLHQLTAIEVQNARQSLHDGGGLWLRIRGRDARWSLRFTVNGIRRELALGICYRNSRDLAARSLTDARTAAAEARSVVHRGDDPLERRRARTSEAKIVLAVQKASERAQARTLLRHLRSYHEQHVEPIRTPKHAAQWISSIEGPPADDRTPEQNRARKELDALLVKPLDGITPIQALDALVPLCRVLPETGFRVAQRLSVAFDAAIIEGLRQDNPIRPIGRELRKRAGRITRGSFAALPFSQAPDFLADLRDEKGIAARMLEFALLTVARTAEVLGMTWGEVRSLDGPQPTWIVPAERMKAREAHTVHLSPAAIAVLLEMRELECPNLVFPAAKSVGTDEPKQQSSMAMLMVLRRMGLNALTTVHGVCRATFSTWAYETAAARPDVIEACLAHQEVDRVKAAYNRAQFTAERKALLQAWGAFLEGRTNDNVVPLKAA